MSQKLNHNNSKEKFYPTNDYLFKRLFGRKGNENITKSLIEAILEKDCQILSVSSDEVTEKDIANDKVGILDIFVKQIDGTGIKLRA